MATTIKILHAKDFLEVTTDGLIDMTSSRALLAAIAAAAPEPADFELLVDFRETHSTLQVFDIYLLASELCKARATFRSKLALLVNPGAGFDQAKFFETCSVNRGCFVAAFTDYETAMHWILNAETMPEIDVPSVPDFEPQGGAS